MELDPFIQGLPKIELHIHLEGTLTPEHRWQLAQKNNIPLPYSSLETMKAGYIPWDRSTLSDQRLGAEGLAQFLEHYYGGIEVLRTEGDFFQLAAAALTKLASMNVRYVEMFFDVQAHTRRGVAVEDVMSGIQRAREDARMAFGIECVYILCFLRDMSVESAEEAYEACRPWQGEVFVGVGLDSDEHDRPPALFDNIFCKARADGLHVTSHCDVAQKDTHKHIRQCIDQLCNGQGLERIDHGLSAAEQPELIEMLRDKGIGLTLAPHGYHRRWPDEEVFPAMRKLFDAGVKVTVNSDDPTYMQDFWVADCYQVMREYCHCSDAEIVQLARNAIDICWASEARKEQLREELNMYAQNKV